MLLELYREWNDKINVVSRKDIENLYLHHVLHSLSISKLVAFPKGEIVLDAGTGGGFPGIPLAIMNPEAEFLLVDSIGKKLEVVDSVAQGIGLDNVSTKHDRVENVKEPFTQVLGRAVSSIKEMINWFKPRIRSGELKQAWFFKGGDVNTELTGIRFQTEVTPISELFEEEWFEGKFIIRIKF